LLPDPDACSAAARSRVMTSGVEEYGTALVRCVMTNDIILSSKYLEAHWAMHINISTKKDFMPNINFDSHRRSKIKEMLRLHLTDDNS
jgi:hypothetical protein